MYSSVLTKIGAAQLANSQITGTALKWSKMGVGDGNGVPVNVNANRTSLVHERYRANINHLYKDPKDPTQIIAELVMLPEEGGYTIREVGIYDTNDKLVVYGSLPEIVKPVLAEGSGVTLTIRCRAVIGDATNVKLIIDPTTVIATRQYVDNKMGTHSQNNDAHPLASVAHPGFMSAADKQAVDKSFRGIKVGNKILYPTGKHQYAELVPQSPVILTPDPTTGKIAVAVNASVTAKVGAVPMADGNGKIHNSYISGINRLTLLAQSGTWEAPKTAVYRFTLKGGGGGGRGACKESDTKYGCGSGGGEGGMCVFYKKINVGIKCPYIIGAGGAGGTASETIELSPAMSGGNTIMTIGGKKQIAYGGAQGAINPATNGLHGGAGGGASLDGVEGIVIKGCCGESASWFNSRWNTGGCGGGNGGAPAYNTAMNGSMGGGGSGGAYWGSAQNGGNGGDGYIMIEYAGDEI